MKTTKVLVILLLLTFLIAACEGTTSPTEGQQGSDATPTPTVPLEPKPTQEPSPTPPPAPVALSADNLGQITLQAVKDLDYPFLSSPEAKWQIAQFSPDGGYVIVDTRRGIDILDSTRLELVHEIRGVTPISFVDGNRIFSTTESDLAFIDYVTGEVQTLGRPDLQTETGWPPIAASPTGGALVISTGANTYEIYSLESKQTTSFELRHKFPILETRDLFYSPNGDYLIAIVFDNLQRHVAVMIDPDTLEEVYEKEFEPGDFIFSTSGEEFAVKTTRGIEITNLSDGELVRLLGANLTEYGSSAHWDFVVNTTNFTVLYQGFREVSNRVFEQKSGMITYDYADQGQAIAFYPSALPGAISQFTYTEDGTQILAVNLDNGLISLNDPETISRTASREYSYGGQPVLSPDGEVIAVPFTSGVTLLDSATLEVVDELDWHNDERRYSHKPILEKSYGTTNLPVSYASLQFIDSEHILVEIHQIVTYGSDYITSEVWNLDTKEKVNAFVDLGDCKMGGNRSVMVCARRLAGEFISLQVFDIFEGTILEVLGPEVDGELGFTFGNQYLVKCFTGASTYTLTPLYKAGLRYLQADCQPFTSLAGDALMLSNGDVISVDTSEVVDTVALTPEDGEKVSNMVVNSTGKFALIGSSIYDLVTGERLSILSGPHEITSAAFSRDGYSLIMITNRGVEYWGVTR